MLCSPEFLFKRTAVDILDTGKEEVAVITNALVVAGNVFGADDGDVSNWLVKGVACVSVADSNGACVVSILGVFSKKEKKFEYNFYYKGLNM